MAVTLSDIRSRFAAAIDERMGADSGYTPAWYEGRTAWPAFPAGETRDHTSAAYAVGVVSTDVLEDRQRRTHRHEVYCATTVSIRWLWRLRADAQVADYGAALDAEVTLVSAIRNYLQTDGELDGRFSSSSTSALGDGTAVLGDIRFIVYHSYPLTRYPSQ